MSCCKDTLKKELEQCLQLWEKQGYCTFGQETKCEQCALPYLLWKLLSGEIIHGPDQPRLTLDQWKEKLKS